MRTFEETFSSLMKSIVTEDVLRMSIFGSLFSLIEKNDGKLRIKAQEALDLAGLSKKYKIFSSMRDQDLYVCLVDSLNASKIAEDMMSLVPAEVLSKYPKFGVALEKILDKTIRERTNGAKGWFNVWRKDGLIIVKKDFLWKETFAHEFIHFVQRFTGHNELRESQLTGLEKGEYDRELVGNKIFSTSIEDAPESSASAITSLREREILAYFNSFCHLLERVGLGTHKRAMYALHQLESAASNAESWPDFIREYKKSVLLKFMKKFKAKTEDETGEKINFGATVRVVLACMFYDKHVQTLNMMAGSYFTD